MLPILYIDELAFETVRHEDNGAVHLPRPLSRLRTLRTLEEDIRRSLQLQPTSPLTAFKTTSKPKRGSIRDVLVRPVKR
jgi:hypothetical protein